MADSSIVNHQYFASFTLFILYPFNINCKLVLISDILEDKMLLVLV